MKILHTLVGYLAVTALPFHPFAFAFPLTAIDHYDGYVDSTTEPKHIDSALMNQLLGDVLETCQTVTSHYYVNATQTHSDNLNASLMQRVPGDIIKGRFAPEVVPAVLFVIAIVLAVALSIIWTEEDVQVRRNESRVVEHSY